MIISVVMRMAMVVGLTLIGFLLLKLNSKALILGFIFGLIGFLIDKVKEK
jgi:ascorbate-specific PTS system EIIC-type component UlaA